MADNARSLAHLGAGGRPIYHVLRNLTGQGGRALPFLSGVEENTNANFAAIGASGKNQTLESAET